MAIAVTVDYTIQNILKSGTNVEVKFLLENDLAPLSRTYFDVYLISQFYSGVGDTDVYADRKEAIDANFTTLAYDTMVGFANEARLLITNAIGGTAGTAVTGAVTFSHREPEITKNLLSSSITVLWDDSKAGI
jgi:hypothetical protein